MEPDGECFIIISSDSEDEGTQFERFDLLMIYHFISVLLAIFPRSASYIEKATWRRPHRPASSSSTFCQLFEADFLSLLIKSDVIFTALHKH